MIGKIGLISGVKKFFNSSYCIKKAAQMITKNSAMKEFKTVPIQAGKIDLIHSNITPEKDISVNSLMKNGYKITRGNVLYNFDEKTYRSFNFNDGKILSMDMIDMKNPTKCTIAQKGKNNNWSIKNYHDDKAAVEIDNASDSAIQNAMNYVFQGHNILGQDEKSIHLKGFGKSHFSISKMDGNEI